MLLKMLSDSFNDWVAAEMMYGVSPVVAAEMR
jgi:hypothetical protein